MPEWIVYAIIAVVALIVLVAAVVLIVKIAKMPAKERKELIVDFLVGLVTVAENAYEEHGKGSEKLAQVEAAFKKTAPWFLKLVLKITKSANLNELIEEALEKAKKAWAK